jgi:ectoine hydroxylase-related dioxygenase (phytanoyl-CoA dioxygenase family)
VIPGSHRGTFGEALRAGKVVGQPAKAVPAHVVETEPGDVIVLDEHLFHASAGGGTRHQWRVDYVRAPEGVEATRRVRAYFARI